MNIDNLTDLSKLITDELSCGKKLYDLQQYIKSYNGTDWKNYVKVNELSYNRSVVLTTSQIEIVVITWNIHQKSKIHDHPEKGCLLKIISGSLIEESYQNNNNVMTLKNEKILAINDIGYQEGANGLHKIINNHDDITVSLHIYSPVGYIPKCYA